MAEEKIEINLASIKKGFNKTFKYLKQKKTSNILTLISLVAILILGIWIRIQNIALLKDSTTGKYIPTALDPFYFLRIAETIVNQGYLPAADVFRHPYQVPFTNEILPWVLVYLHKFLSIFNSEISIQYVGIIYPVIFFALGIVTFFFLTYFLTHSKITALISSLFLVIMPSYIYRTTAGFSDHESIGIFAFFLALSVLTLSLRFLEKNKEPDAFVKFSLWGLLLGLVTSFTIASWGGVANLLFMIIPFSFLIFWILKAKEIPENRYEKRKFVNYIIFYSSWFLFSIVSTLFYGYGLNDVLGRIVFSATSILTPMALLFIAIDFFLITRGKHLLKEKQRKYRILYSFLGVLVLGLLFFILSGHSITSLTENISTRLLHPFGTDRVSLTVAENQQPFLNDWISQTGKIFFWFFFAGLLTIGISLASGIKSHRRKFLVATLWILFMFGILFSRISGDSLFNGANPISKLFYFGSAILFLFYFLKTYLNEKIRFSPETIVIFSWTIFMLIAARGAVRTFFLITPFACFSFGLLISNTTKYLKKSKDDLLKTLLVIGLIVIIIFSIVSFNNLYPSAVAQGKSIGPGAGYQWQHAMKWVRENTPKGSVFAHWWDYGYWVQYLGERPTLADGGHFEGAFRDHLIGRYLLTTPTPETALSFLKSNNVSYLLIDPTDIGKYSAYSTIGSDKTKTDRASHIPIMMLNSRQAQETGSELRFYSGGAYIDGDIIYQDENGNEIFLPSRSAAIGGIIIEINTNSSSGIQIGQPQGLFIYNNQQIRIPLRYVYYNGELMDFKSGIEAAAYIVPVLSQSGPQGLNIDQFGAVTYLSEKTFPSLVAQLYLMNDPLNKYPTIKIAHKEQDPFVNSLRSRGIVIEDIVLFNGIRGPIKIWDTREIPEEILAKEEFLRQVGEFAEFDDLQFIA